MDPVVVGSPTFGQLFQTLLPGNYGGHPETIYSQPLVYTTSDGIQYVFVATTQNNLYKLDAKTGAIVAQRNLHIPFLAADLDGCVDISPHVGVTATGVIDPTTDTLYLTCKTYVDQTQINVAQGRPAGRYYLHAINLNDLSERANFPVDLEGTVALNNPIRSFNGGIHHQRPALLHSGQFIYAGFASHCVKWNFTGWIMGWNKDTGANVERFATEGLGVPNTTPGGGVWMSGGGLASDDAGSMFFATGNGYASQLNTIPVNGRDPPTALEEAAVHMTINMDGSLTIVDFFMPWEKTQLDGADRDLGTSPLELLPSEFSCGDIKRIGVVTGKSGKTYWLNLDDLGGYQNGPNKLDNVIEVYQNENSVYAGAGVYPLEGGYIYINVIQYPTHVFKFSCNNGVPSFTKVADSPTNNAYILGVGHGTTTSLNGQAGTGLVWTSDVEGFNLKIYNAVPVNGNMTMINSFNIPGITKFTRPVFGDGRVYLGTTKGYLYGFGAPVNLPLNCSLPYNFGTANLNTSTTATTITCKANIALTISSIALSGNANFKVTGLPTTPFAAAAGSTFSFQAYFAPQSVGPLSSNVLVTTINSVAGYSAATPISLQGNGQSVNALLSITPITLAFQGLVTGEQFGGVNQSVIFNNLGNSPLTITNIQYSLVSETGPFVPANGTAANSQAGAFTFIGLPTTIPGNSGVTVTVNFNTDVSGNFATYISVISNGGTVAFDVVGTSGSQPIAVVEFQTPDELGWVEYTNTTTFTFGNVTENTTKFLKLRVTNNATAESARLSLTVSKPPFGVAGIIGTNNNVDLAEGTSLAPGENATATMYCSAPKTQWNTYSYNGTATWEMNVNDPNFTKQSIPFFCEAVAEQAPPLQSNGYGYYRYEGCYKDNNPNRQLQTQLYGSNNNTIKMCIAACAAGGYTYCGLQYNRECWAGPKIPVLEVDDDNCNYPCSGNVNEICGGNGVGDGAGGAYISLFSNTQSLPDAPLTGPFVNPGVDGYTSIGCYTEATNSRALPFGQTIVNKSVANCVAACSAAANYIYAGVEYGGECWCGNVFSAGAVPAPITDSNATEYCGAGNRLNVYKLNSALQPNSSVSSSTLNTSASTISPTSTNTSMPVSITSYTATPTQSGPAIKYQVGNWAFQGCFTEATTGRALQVSTFANDSMTLELCSAFCAGNSMFGVEYGRECYCGNTLGAGSVKATIQSDCNFRCPGNVMEYCGAGNRLELYSLISSISSTSILVSSTTSILISSSAPTLVSTTLPPTTKSSGMPTGPTIVPSASGYNYLGCYTEGVNTRALSGGLYANDSMTIQMCAVSCSAYTYFGAEYSRECWCGNSFGAGANLTSNSNCSMACAGDSTEYCGAGNRLSVYMKGSASSSAIRSSPALNSSIVSSSLVVSSSLSSKSSTSDPSSTATPTTTVRFVSTGNVNFTYYACASEPSSGRLLPTQVENNGTSMTIERCLGECWQYAYAGVEYGRECWCGNVLNVNGNAGANPSTNMTDASCNFICPGNSTEYCGAGSKLSLYWFDEVKAVRNGGGRKS
ncbi:hypothetical protein B7494_g8209 [Chlorociboria aeruginascens]|nr:hypothetical protein B7494_g8209 [Chlorociboria aeruginascens]